MEIITEQDYETALEQISKLMSLDPKRDSSEGKELDELVDEVMEYEEINYPI